MAVNCEGSDEMNPEKLYKFLVWMVVALAFADMLTAFRWMMRMATGAVGGVPADIALVLNFLDAILMGYVAYHYVLHRDDLSWLNLSEEGQFIRKVFIATIVVSLFAPVFEKAAVL